MVLKCFNEMFVLDTQNILLTFVMLNPGPVVINLFSCSPQVSIKFILLINVKMATKIVGILTFISWINTTSESLKA